jgi:hypothetical protein
MFSSILFLKFLRQAEEHFSQPDILEVRDLELKLALRIWQIKKEECYEIGKEMIRVLTNVAKLK